MRSKLDQALQQRFQLALQQSYSIGNFLSACIHKHRELTSHQEGERRRGRPRVDSLLDILDGIAEFGTSASSLQDHVLLFQTVCHFPLLNFVNEPMCHFVTGEVRTAVAHLADRIHHDCRVPDNLHQANINGNIFTSTVSNTQSPPLSDPINYQTVTPVDGDGFATNIDRNKEKPLQDAVYVRFHGIDAPELSAVHFFKTNDLDHVFVKRIGHLSMCAVHFFLRLFISQGSAELCEELVREGFLQTIDVYNRPIKEYWLKFSSSAVTESEQTFIEYLEILVNGKPEMRERLMSPFQITTACPSKPFLISLNALLVITGFCHVFTKYMQDNRLLALQAVAKENKIGPLWCDATRNYIYGAQCDTSEDAVLRHFTVTSAANASANYYSEKILPWHERQATKQLCSLKTTRTEANANLTKALVGREPHSGMYIDITR